MILQNYRKVKLDDGHSIPYPSTHFLKAWAN